MLTVSFSKSTMKRTQVQLWYNRFKEGREGVNDNALKMSVWTNVLDKYSGSEYPLE